MFFFEIFQAEKYRSNLTLQLFIVYLNKITIIACIEKLKPKVHTSEKK